MRELSLTGGDSVFAFVISRILFMRVAWLLLSFVPTVS